MTTEEGLAALIIINALGLVGLLYVLHKNKDGSLEDRILDGPIWAALSCVAAIAIDVFALLILAIRLLSQML